MQDTVTVFLDNAAATLAVIYMHIHVVDLSAEQPSASGKPLYLVLHYLLLASISFFLLAL